MLNSTLNAGILGGDQQTGAAVFGNGDDDRMQARFGEGAAVSSGPMDAVFAPSLGMKGVDHAAIESEGVVGRGALLGVFMGVAIMDEHLIRGVYYKR